MIFAAAPLPFVLGDVDGDAVKVGGDLRVAAEVGECAKEPKEDGLGKIFKLGLLHTRASQPSEGAEDHLLMVLDDLLEAEWCGQGGGSEALDLRVRPKFHEHK